MRILGIDPGLHATGYGVISASSEGLRLISAGAIHPSSPRVPLGRRLQELYDGLREVIATSQPQALALESVYTHHAYLTTAALMAHARGVICLLGAQQGLPLAEYLPTRVKKALTGQGHASKEQVARAVGMWLNVDASAWASDVTDALALAITYAQISKVHAAMPVLAHRRARRRQRAAFSPVSG
ncbi:MAG: crossover junction endodeoxyribonuclease RuvC [Candidatus Omnitrophica bacterium]|nr:crossover junction endodeoxyribonuclease RuvC [Candidatus Omnitrophota bacterium]